MPSCPAALSNTRKQPCLLQPGRLHHAIQVAVYESWSWEKGSSPHTANSSAASRPSGVCRKFQSPKGPLSSSRNSPRSSSFPPGYRDIVSIAHDESDAYTHIYRKSLLAEASSASKRITELEKRLGGL